jgi:hypothetical protein
MSTDHLGRVAEAARHAPRNSSPHLPAELQLAVATAADNGESLAAIAAAADVPSLAVLDAIDARTRPAQ